jgi:hypothetical protein
MRIDRYAAALPACPDPAKHKHPVAEIAELLRKRLERLTVPTHIRGELFDALASALDAAIESPDDCRVPPVVGGQELGERAIDITAVEGIGHSLGDVHFVSRHLRASIPQPRCGSVRGRTRR